MFIRTRMCCSIAMQQSCTRQPRQLFPANNEKVEERGGRRSRRRGRKFTTTIQSSVATKQSFTHCECNRFFPVNEENEKYKEVKEEHKDEKRKGRWRRRRRRKRSQLQCNFLQQCSRVLLVAKAIVFSEQGEGGGEGEEEEEKKERRWRSELQCSLLQQCSRVVFVSQGNCFFAVNNEKMEKGKEVEEEEIHNYNAVFRGNERELYSW